MPTSKYLANLYLNKTHNGEDFTIPNRYIGLLTTIPDVNDVGSVELTAVGYVRLPVAFLRAINRVNASSADLLWPQAAALWGTVVAWAEFDALVAGHILYWNYLKDSNGNTITRVVDVGDQMRVASGNLTIRQD